MRVAALIIGIDGWDKYTWPLYKSIQQHEPGCDVVIIDNASKEPYPALPFVHRTERLCYSKAINTAARIANAYDVTVARQPEPADWFVVLSNDVLCTGPFIHILETYSGDDVVGPLLKNIRIERVGTVHYIEGWCVAVHRKIWDTIGGWDEGMKVSSYEDCEYSHRARVNGFGLVEDAALPFIHLDQKQRFYLVPNYWDSEYHNRARFIEKYAVVNH